jgi:hypothetical protein
MALRGEQGPVCEGSASIANITSSCDHFTQFDNVLEIEILFIYNSE